MKEMLKTFSVTVVGTLFMGLVFWLILQHEMKPSTLSEIQVRPDSVAAAKEALKSPILAGKVAATIEHCKLYELETDKGAWLYWSICYDKDMRISTSVTVVHKLNNLVK